MSKKPDTVLLIDDTVQILNALATAIGLNKIN